MPHFNEQLRQLRHQLTHKKHLEAMMEDLTAQREDLEKFHRIIASRAEQERADVEQLEAHTLKNFFLRFTGKLQSKLEREQAEAYAAAARCEASAQQLDSITETLRKLRYEWLDLSQVEENYRRLIREKAAELKASGKAAQIFSLEEQILTIENENRELLQAIRSGEIARDLAASALEDVDAAANWGIVDIAGGSLISTAVKHSLLDDAQTTIEKLQNELHYFKAELADVEISEELKVNTDGFLLFTDYLLDGLFGDWMVQSQIHDSISQLSSLHAQIDVLLHFLERQMKQKQAYQAKLQEQLDEEVIQLAQHA